MAGKIKLLDVVEIPLASCSPKDRYQRENRFVESWDWEVIGNVSSMDIFNYCEDNTIILHSRNDRVIPQVLEALPFEEWKSLQLVRADVIFKRDYWNRNRWRASFYDGSVNLLYLKVDYLEVVARRNNDEEIESDCLLTISLARPWTPPDGSQPERCYKLVAGIIEL